MNSAIGEGMNESVLALACALGHWDIVDLLVECGANLHYLCGVSLYCRILVNVEYWGSEHE